MLTELLQLMRRRRAYYRAVFEFDEDLYPVVNLSSTFFCLFVCLASLPFYHRLLLDCYLSTPAYYLHVGGIMTLYVTLTRLRIWFETVYNPNWYRELRELDREVATFIMELTVEDFLGETNGREILLELLAHQRYRCHFAHYYTLWLRAPRHVRILRDLGRWRFLYHRPAACG